uniref:Uncharacterized protein n=1 Tax=Caenorhabditis japonica TaxID=281687 RepID=A0A8R1J156_CAEJA
MRTPGHPAKDLKDRRPTERISGNSPQEESHQLRQELPRNEIRTPSRRKTTIKNEPRGVENAKNNKSGTSKVAITKITADGGV